MATSFAAYASQFLNRQQQAGQAGPESSLSSSQPLFYSFTTHDGSHAGNAHNSELDDLDDPHLRTSEQPANSRHTLRGRGDDDYNDDPYLRLDEEEQGLSRHQSPSMPLLGVSEPDASKRLACACFTVAVSVTLINRIGSSTVQHTKSTAHSSSP